MTSMELFTALGGISAEALSGMEELQMNAPAPLPHRKPIARGLLIAAMISLLLLLSGCCLYVITRNLNWSKELELDLRPYNEATDIGCMSKNWMLDEAAIELSAAPPVDGQVEITCQEWGLNSEGTLTIGTEYWIEKWNGKTYEEIPTLDSTPWLVPEQQVICGTESSWTVDYREKYGDLEPGNYRIGLMVSKEAQDGTLAELGCFAKFRVQETNLAPYLEQFNQAFQALTRRESCHFQRIDYLNNQVPNDPGEYDVRSEEIWKSGSNYLACDSVKKVVEESLPPSTGGRLLRDGNGYILDWEEGFVSGPPESWITVDFYKDLFFWDWEYSSYASAYQYAIDAQSFDGQMNIILDEGDFGGERMYFEIRAFFDDNGDIRRLEYSRIPDPAYSEEDRLPWDTVEFFPTPAEEIAQRIQGIDLTSASPFSFAEDQQQIEANGYVVKTDGFHNTTAQGQVNIESATKLAKAEVTSKSNIVRVCYDPDVGIWKVTFTYSQDDSIYYAVYMDNAGITQMIVSK